MPAVNEEGRQEGAELAVLGHLGMGWEGAKPDGSGPTEPFMGPRSTHSTLHPGGTANPPRPLPVPLLRHKEMGGTSRVQVHSCWPASTDTLMEASYVC